MRKRSRQTAAAKPRTPPAGGDSPYTFERGFPTEETAQRVHDEQDYRRAVEAYRFFYPVVSMEGIFAGQREAGAEDNTSVLMMAAGPRHVMFTANSDTPYAAGTLDLRQAGPMVVEMPPGPFMAVVDDHYHRWVQDMGLPGPDAGKGGKYLILPPDYQGETLHGYYQARAATYKVLVALRSIPVDGNLQRALNDLPRAKIYPLSQAQSPPPFGFLDVSNRHVDLSSLRWEDNLGYWETLHQVIDLEPPLDEFRAMFGLLVALGIEKGKPFAPDARMRATLERAAKAGRDQMLVEAFASSRPDRIAWRDRQWEWLTLRWENGDFELPSAIDIEARERWFAQAIGASPAMCRRQVGEGSLYWLGARDKTGAYLDGARTYTLNVPQPVPANLFWSVTVYDAATRSQVQTDQDKAALRSLFETFTPNADGSVDLYFGPRAPAGKEGQWIGTAPA